MTKVINGRIVSTTQDKSSTRAKAAAVLARLDEMSANLADDISHYEDDATFDLSVKQEAIKMPSADVMKRLERVSKSNDVAFYDDEASHGVDSNDDSTVYEEISYGLARVNEELNASALKSKMIGDKNEVQEMRASLRAKNATAREPSNITPLLPALIEDKEEELEDLRNIHSCSFDGSDSSSDDFSIEEVEEEIITETTPVLPRPPPSPVTKHTISSMLSSSNTGRKHKHEHSIDKYVHSLPMDHSVLDDASILDMQMSKTPKMKNNKKCLVGRKGGFDASRSDGSNVRSSLFPPHLIVSSESHNSSSSEVLSVKSDKSRASISTEKTDNTRGSWGLFSRAAPNPAAEEVKTTSSSAKSDASCLSLSLFSRAAPKLDKKSSDERSEMSHFNPPSHLSIDIESASSNRQGKKRNNISSASSRVSSASSLDDETDHIIRAAIAIKNNNAKRCRRGVVGGVVVVFIAAISVLGALVYTDNLPGFLREPITKLGAIPSPPTAESDANVEPKGVEDAVWYADFDQFKCVQNCDESSESVTCGDEMKTWEQGFATLEECCLDNFSTFIGKDWSLRDCIALSYPAPSTDATDNSTDVPTYMPTAGEMFTQNEVEGVKQESVSGTTPWAEHPTKENDSGYILELDENFQPIKTTEPPKKGNAASGTTPWAIGDSAAKDDSGHVVELDENYNPIHHVTTVAATTTKQQEVVVTTSAEDHISAVSENGSATVPAINNAMATTSAEITSAEIKEGTYALVYYADWEVNTCLFKGADELQSWQKPYLTENECCLDNFDWDINGKCFRTKPPVTNSPTSSISPSDPPSLQPTVSSQPTRVVLVWIHFNTKCIKVNKNSIKINTKSYESQDKCHLDNNLGDYKPTTSPSFSPTTAPSFSPTVDPTSESITMTPSNPPTDSPDTSSKVGMNICLTEFCKYEITSDYTFEYKVNIPDNASMEDCSGCSLSVRLTYDYETSWIGMAFSTTGEMIGSEAVIGVPGMVPAKYHLTGKFETAVQPMSEEKQTLVDPIIELVDGQTILSFTKLLSEEGEIEVSTGSNIFLWAHGSSVDNSYHGQNKGSFSIDLLKIGSSRSDDAADSLKVRHEETAKTTNRPTIKTAASSSQNPSTKAPNKPTANVTTKPTMKTTARNTSSPTAKPSSVTQDSLMELLLTKSPNTNRTEMMLDTSSAQYLAWRWLKKNPDLSTISDERKVQRWALATFYRALHGDEWTFGEGWLQISSSGVDECTWYNVLCDSSGYVVSIDLRNNYLWGYTPVEIALLNKCEYLGLSSNYLTTIQPAIFQMSSLKILDMDDNGIEFIPPDINTSTGLEELHLSHNKIEDIPDAIFELNNLRAFYIPDNWISSKMTSKFSQLSALEVLDMDMNYMTGTLPSEIGLLRDTLTELHLSRNMLTGRLPTELSQLERLTILDISMNYLNSNIISDIGNLQNLVALRLDNNYRLNESGELVSSGITGTIPNSIGALKQLRELRLDNNFVEGPLPSALGDLSSLEVLRIESNNIYGTIPSELGNAINLQYLHLWSNYIEGTIPKNLGNLAQLKELFLDDNELTGSIPSDLGGLANVDYLALASNNLESTIPSELGKLPALTKLELQSNYLYGEVPNELGNSPIVLMQLEDNFLYGDLPEQVCQSKTIQYISGSCPVMPDEPTAAPISSIGNMDSVPLTQASTSARNGVRANNNIRTRTKANGTRANGSRANANRNSSRAKKQKRKRDGSRQSNKQTSRQLAPNAPTQSPTLEYWWSCNCCSECLPVQ